MKSKSTPLILGCNHLFIAICLLASGLAVPTAIAQLPSPSIEQWPNLSPIVKSRPVTNGVVPRRVAFQIFLQLLTVLPDDAAYRKQRARAIESKRIGLTPDDIEQLDRIVEKYRVEEAAMTNRINNLRDIASATHQDFANEHYQEIALLRTINAEINSNLSIDGRKSITAFLKQIVQNSQIHPKVSATSSGGHQ